MATSSVYVQSGFSFWVAVHAKKGIGWPEVPGSDSLLRHRRLKPIDGLVHGWPLYHINNVLFTLWNLGAALSPTWGAVLAFLLLSGLAGSCSVTIGSGSIADCVRKERRGLVTTIFSEYPTLRCVHDRC